MSDPVAALYAARAARADAEAAREGDLSRQLSWLRVAVAAVAATAFVLWLLDRGGRPMAWLAAAAVAVFAALAVWHGRVERRRARAAGHAA